MAATQSSIVYSSDFDPRIGEAVAVGPGLVRITAPNSGPFTFTGTNSFIIGDARVAIVDPGPDDPDHLEALVKAVAGRTVDAILLTHTHRDHSALAPRLKSLTGAPLVFGGAHRLSRPLRFMEINPFAASSDFALKPDTTIADGEALEFGGVNILAVATPGHCANHFAFALADTDMVLVGDHLMAWNSTVVATPDGSLSDYLSSLERMIGLPQGRYIPAHGGEITNGPAFASAMRTHRLMRNGQILEALGSGPKSIRQLGNAIYPTLSPKVRIGAERTLLSHAEYLEAQGAVRVHRRLWGTKISLCV